jgi:phosphoribosylformylglycinamidine (FGAM) synthase PurS component
MFRTQTYRIEVHQRTAPDQSDNQHTWTTVNLFFLRGPLALADVQRLAAELLADPVTETFVIRSLEQREEHATVEPAQHTVEVTLLPGVTDPAAENLVRAAHLLGLTALEQAATGQQYVVDGIHGRPRLSDLHRRLCPTGGRTIRLKLCR